MILHQPVSPHLEHYTKSLVWSYSQVKDHYTVSSGWSYISLFHLGQNIIQILQGDLISACFIWVRTLHRIIRVILHQPVLSGSENYRFLWVILHQFVLSGSEHHTDSSGYSKSDASLRFLRQLEGQMNCKHQCVENQRPWGSSLPAEGIKFSPLF